MPKKEGEEEKIELPVRPDMDQIAIQNHIMLKELLKIAKE